MKYLLFVLIAALAFSLGCGKPYTVGTPFDRAKVDQIVPGKTTEDNVVQMFGQPSAKETTGAGETRYVYSYFRAVPKFWSKDTEEKTNLEVYSRNGVVQRYEVRKEGINQVRE